MCHFGYLKFPPSSDNTILHREKSGSTFISVEVFRAKHNVEYSKQFPQDDKVIFSSYG